MKKPKKESFIEKYGLNPSSFIVLTPFALFLIPLFLWVQFKDWKIGKKFGDTLSLVYEKRKRL